MRRSFILLLLCVTCHSLLAQTRLDFDFFRFTDFHIHPGYKHYFRPQTADSMRMILDATTYDAKGDSFVFKQEVKQWFENVNWTKYGGTAWNDLQNGLTSNIQNYDQASYPEIMYTPGSLLTNSFSPYEKQFALKKGKRKMAVKVAGMGMERLTYYGDDKHTPFDDFLAEYYFILMQETEKWVKIESPRFLYKSDGNAKEPLKGYYNKIKMVKDAAELQSILKANDQLFKEGPKAGKPYHFITPMVMSIEGAQVLYGPLSGSKKYILNPLNARHIKQGHWAPDATRDSIHNELLDNVYKLRNLPHRLFFITPGHFAQNHVVGYAKTLDRDPENYQHRGLAFVTKFPKLRNDILRKTYDGFNPYQDIGFKVVRAFLDPSRAASKYEKPTYIDVKHMDVKARIEYYYKRREYEREWKIRIPIVASHFGVSGENQAMAAATGLWPNFDRYAEIDETENFYRSEILIGENNKARHRYWTTGVMRAKRYPQHDSLNAFERAMYKPLNFLDPEILTRNDLHDPFINYKLGSNKHVGWFYPWSINLFDEEIIEINKSDGIIGILLDPRQLGAFMKNYNKEYFKELKEKFKTVKATIDAEKIKEYGLRAEDIDEIEYCKIEPLLRNMFYIVHLLYQQEHAETMSNDTERQKMYPWFVKDDSTMKKRPWETIAIGSDYDGLIDPFDFSPTAQYVPKLHQRLIFYAFIFAVIHHSDFYESPGRGRLISDIDDSAKKMKMFFYGNGEKFIKTYF